jgi:DNA-binding response OmpR family regulator
MIWDVLIIAEDSSHHQLVADRLRHAGIEVTCVHDGQGALDLVQRDGLPHLAVIYHTLPDVDGIELARNFADRGAPVIVVGGDSPQTAIQSLEWADDYLRQPYAADELAARIRRVLSRVVDYSYAKRVIVQIDERLQFDPAHDLLVVEGEDVRLTPTESRLLHMLLRHKGRVVESQSLLTQAWPSKTVYEDTLRVHVHRLRSKLEVDPRDPAYIRVVRGVGYAFHV